MNALVVACLAAGAITFQPQELPELRLGPIPCFSELPQVNYRQTDMNGDGVPDLVLDTALWIQRAGLFPPQQRQPLPPEALGALMDVWDGRIFCIGAGRLSVFCWKDGALAAQTKQKLDWPDTDDGSRSGLSRFLEDIDGDRQPELIAVDQHALTVYAFRNGKYVEAAQRTDILPELRSQQTIRQPLWPKPRRALLFPARQMACDLILDGPVLSMVLRDPVRAGEFVFRRNTWMLCSREGEFRTDTPVVSCSAPVPGHVRPCRLNGDDTLDLAGCRHVESTGRSIPVSMLETWASLDGGKTFEMRRSPAVEGFLPQAPFMDVNNDGLADIVTESTGLFEGGAREMVERFMTGTVFSHTVCVYPQSSGSFSATTAAELKVEIRLETAPWRMPPMYVRYRTGTLVNISGDFNGDGHHDIAVRDRCDRVAVWLARGWTFSDRPDVTVRIAPASEYAVADVNGDGCSDIVETREASRQAQKPGRTVLVHFAGAGKGDNP